VGLGFFGGQEPCLECCRRQPAIQQQWQGQLSVSQLLTASQQQHHRWVWALGEGGLRTLFGVLQAAASHPAAIAGATVGQPAADSFTAAPAQVGLGWGA
jgi:hypothetical protein